MTASAVSSADKKSKALKAELLSAVSSTDKKSKASKAELLTEITKLREEIDGKV